MTRDTVRNADSTLLFVCAASVFLPVIMLTRCMLLLGEIIITLQHAATLCVCVFFLNLENTVMQVSPRGQRGHAPLGFHS